MRAARHPSAMTVFQSFLGFSSQSRSCTIPLSSEFTEKANIFHTASHVSGPMSRFRMTVNTNLLPNPGPLMQPLSEFHEMTNKESWWLNEPPSPCSLMGTVFSICSFMRPGCSVTIWEFDIFCQSVSIIPSVHPTCVCHMLFRSTNRLLKNSCGSRNGCSMFWPVLPGTLTHVIGGAPNGLPKNASNARWAFCKCLPLLPALANISTPDAPCNIAPSAKYCTCGLLNSFVAHCRNNRSFNGLLTAAPHPCQVCPAIVAKSTLPSHLAPNQYWAHVKTTTMKPAVHSKHYRYVFVSAPTVRWCNLRQYAKQTTAYKPFWTTASCKQLAIWNELKTFKNIGNPVTLPYSSMPMQT